jgi:hypothetical protein
MIPITTDIFQFRIRRRYHRFMRVFLAQMFQERDQFSLT